MTDKPRHKPWFGSHSSVRYDMEETAESMAATLTEAARLARAGQMKQVH